VVDRPGRVDRRPAPNAQDAKRSKEDRVTPSPDPDRLAAPGRRAGPAAAEERLVAFWMTIDAGPKAVAMDVIA
jgi:hypothetical protein